MGHPGSLSYIGVAVAIAALAVVGGSLPLFLRDTKIVSSTTRRRLVGIGSCFAGGLLVAAGFIHLLPEAMEMLDSDEGYPVAMLICSLALIGTMLLESAAHPSPPGASTRREHPKEGSPAAGTDEACCTCLCPRRTAAAAHARQPQEPQEPLDSWTADHEHEQAELMMRMHSSADTLTAGVTFAAFAFHSVMEGLALGISHEIFEMFLAISAHKFFAAFALGTSLSRARHADGTPFSVRTLACCIGLFAALTPLGILLGRLVLRKESEGLVPGVLTGLASGTFLYMGVIEISVKELADSEHGDGATKVQKGVALLLGYAAMALLGIWV